MGVKELDTLFDSNPSKLGFCVCGQPTEVILILQIREGTHRQERGKRSINRSKNLCVKCASERFEKALAIVTCNMDSVI